MASNATQNMIGITACVVMAAIIPFALVARTRSIRNGTLPPHLILDMAKQYKFKAQRPNPMFADGREERPRIAHTLAIEDLEVRNQNSTDPHGERVVNNAIYAADPQIVMPLTTQDEYDRVMLGQTKDTRTGDAEFITTVPAPFKCTTDFIKRGQERFDIYCAPCHGETGYGDGMVARRAAEYQEAGNADAAGAWVQPTNYHTATAMALPIGSIYNTITNGIRNMPRYDKQIPTADRWAIAAYVKALQISQGIAPDQLPAAMREHLSSRISTPSATLAKAESN